MLLNLPTIMMLISLMSAASSLVLIFLNLKVLLSMDLHNSTMKIPLNIFIRLIHMMGPWQKRLSGKIAAPMWIFIFLITNIHVRLVTLTFHMMVGAPSHRP